jgi:hypothetical protein
VAAAAEEVQSSSVASPSVARSLVERAGELAAELGGKNGREVALDTFFGHVKCLNSEPLSSEIVWWVEE